MPLLAAAIEPLPSWVLASLGVAGLCGLVLLRGYRIQAGWRAAALAGVRLVSGLLVLYALLGGVLQALQTVVPELSVQITPVWSWPMVIAMSLSTVGVVLGTYPSRLKGLPGWQRGLLLGLRLTAAILLILAMIRPALQWSRKNDRSAIFAVLSDQSRSMLTKDEPGGRSRFESQQEVLREARPIFEKLRQKMQVAEYTYSQELVPLAATAEPASAQPATGAPEGNQSAIGFALESVQKQYPNQPLTGVLVLGDFSQRALAPYDLDPRIAAQRLAELRIPIHTVTFGVSSLASKSRDLIAEDLTVNPTVFVKNTVVVGARIRALGAAGREQTVQLLVEQPTQRRPGEPPQMEVRKSLRIKPTSSDEVIPVELDFIPQLPGEFRVSMRVVPDEGEPITSNNELTTFISVLKGGLSIAYFDKARDEIKPILGLAKSPDIRLDFKLVRFGNRLANFELEPDWFQPGKYDVYIIGDVPAEIFKATKGGKAPLDAIHEAVERGGGLLMLGGQFNYAAGGYADTPLAVTLPVFLNPAEKQRAGRVNKDLHWLTPQTIVPTADGLNHFVMRIDSPAQNLARWQALPPLNGANKLGRPKDGAQVLARNQERMPLLVAQDYGRGRSMAFAGDTTFLWALAGHEDVSQRFWRQVIMWLAHKELEGDSSIWLKLAERRFRPGQPVDMVFGAKNKDGVAIPDAQFKVQVFDSKGVPHQIPAQQSGSDQVGRFTETLVPGEYTVTVDADAQGKSVGSPARARFIVYEYDLEMTNPSADPGLASELAQLTEGETLKAEEVNDFLTRLQRKDLQLDNSRLMTVSLWDNWIFLLLFVSVMTVEWFLRKTRGLV